MKYGNVFGGISLPERLTDEEFEFYYNKFKNGDFEARDILINHNIRLVLTLIKRKFSANEYEVEELLSVGIIGLIKAVDTYDQSKNDKLSGYASKCIKSEIIKYLIKNDRYKEIEFVSLDESILSEDSNSLRGEIITDVYNMEEEFLDKVMRESEYSLLRKILETLDDREKEIILMYYGFKDGRRYKQKDIADILNISRARVGKIISCTLIKIKQRILFEQRYMEYTKGNVLSRKLI